MILNRQVESTDGRLWRLFMASAIGISALAVGIIFPASVTGIEPQVETELVPVTAETSAPAPSGSPLPDGMGRISLGFGMTIHPFSGESFFHTAVDIAALPGTPILATMSGMVSEIGNEPHKRGIYIIIEGSEGLEIEFTHLDRCTLKSGASVHKGDTVGFLGNTGLSTGPHVHYEIRQNGKAIDPTSTMSLNYPDPIS